MVDIKKLREDARVRADKKWDGIRGYITNSSAPMRDVAASYKPTVGD